ncbi:MAG: alpha/beta hydrolase [Chloroflexi bacterium]|nr:alpha/beta hydrolase [Chloroflexota bacterium]
MSEQTPTIVLVHGAWADASSWDPVAQRLQREGHTVVAPANPLRGLTSDSAYIASVLTALPGPIVLVGHSYGGAVITSAATGNTNVRALVYIAAFIPDAGETLIELLKFPGSLIVVPPSDNATVTARPFPGGVDFYVKADSFRQIFAADLPAEKTALMEAAQRPLAAAAFAEAAGPPAWKSIPTWALVATQDNTIGTANTRFMANRAAPSHTVEIAASHVAMLSQPQAVVDLIGEAIGGM